MNVRRILFIALKSVNMYVISQVSLIHSPIYFIVQDENNLYFSIRVNSSERIIGTPSARASLEHSNHRSCTDYDELATRIEELEPSEREAAGMLSRELMKFKRKPPRGRSHWIHLLWRLIQAYSGSEHPTVEDMEEFTKRVNN